MNEDDPVLTEAHRRTKAFARELEVEEFPAEVIMDALLGVGVNAYVQLGGRPLCATVLRKFADVIETGGIVTAHSYDN